VFDSGVCKQEVPIPSFSLHASPVGSARRNRFTKNLPFVEVKESGFKVIIIYMSLLEKVFFRELFLLRNVEGVPEDVRIRKMFFRRVSLRMKERGFL
jgi:hypothetical protein